MERACSARALESAQRTALSRKHARRAYTGGKDGEEVFCEKMCFPEVHLPKQHIFSKPHLLNHTSSQTRIISNAHLLKHTSSQKHIFSLTDIGLSLMEAIWGASRPAFTPWAARGQERCAQGQRGRGVCPHPNEKCLKNRGLHHAPCGPIGTEGGRCEARALRRAAHASRPWSLEDHSPANDSKPRDARYRLVH